MKTNSILLVLVIILFACLSVVQSCGKKDLPPIDGDGYTYSTVEISGRIWFAENLKYKTPNSWCYNNDEANGDTFGRLYTWDDAIQACPKGWHLPSEEEWNSIYWSRNNLHAVMAGMRSDQGLFYGQGDWTTWWSSDKNNNHNTIFTVSYDYDNFVYNYIEKGVGLSVRCVKD